MTCFHCTDGTCSCLSCGKESNHGWQPGVCVVCKNRAFNEALGKYMDKHRIDPREAKHWRREGNKRDQAAAKLVFIPEVEFRKTWVK